MNPNKTTKNKMGLWLLKWRHHSKLYKWCWWDRVVYWAVSLHHCPLAKFEWIWAHFTHFKFFFPFAFAIICISCLIYILLLETFFVISTKCVQKTLCVGCEKIWLDGLQCLKKKEWKFRAEIGLSGAISIGLESLSWTKLTHKMCS